MDNEILKPVLAGLVRHGATSLGGALVASGVLQSSQLQDFIGAVILLAGVLWSWWQKQGQKDVQDALKKVTARATTADAVAAAKVAAPGSAVPKVILFAVLAASFLLTAPPVFAQTKRAAPTAATQANPFQAVLDGINQKVAAINAFTLDDAQAAMTMAANDPVGLQCYTAIANKIEANQASGTSILPKKLGLLQLIETARLTKLQVTAVQTGVDPVVQNCAALILDVNATLLMLQGQGAAALLLSPIK